MSRHLLARLRRAALRRPRGALRVSRGGGGGAGRAAPGSHHALLRGRGTRDILGVEKAVRIGFRWCFDVQRRQTQAGALWTNAL